MKQFKCQLCGNIWTDNSKNGSIISCPKCKNKKIGTPPKKDNKILKTLDSITSYCAKTIALVYYHILQLLQNIIFRYESDIKSFITIFIVIGIIAFLKFNLFITEPLYILGSIVIVSLLITKIKF